MIHTTFEREPGGRTLRGDVRLPDGPPPRSAVVVAHGFRGFKDHGFIPWISGRLLADGHATVAFNFSGSGIGAEPRSRTETELFATDTYTREVGELGWIVEALREGGLLPLRPRKVGLLGHGRGGAVAILHTAASGGVDALVTWAAMASFDRWSDETRAEWRASGRTFVLDELSGRHLPVDVALLDDYEANRDRLDIAAAAGRIAVPWAIVHGEEDRRVAPDEARTLARAAGSAGATRPPFPARLHLLEGADHTFGAADPMDRPGPGLLEAERVTRRHFERHLGAG